MSQSSQMSYQQWRSHKKSSGCPTRTPATKQTYRKLTQRCKIYILRSTFCQRSILRSSLIEVALCLRNITLLGCNYGTQIVSLCRLIARQVTLCSCEIAILNSGNSGIVTRKRLRRCCKTAFWLFKMGICYNKCWKISW